MALVIEQQSNVIRLTSNAAAPSTEAGILEGPLHISQIKINTGTSSSILLRDKTATGMRMFFQDGTTDLVQECPINTMSDLYILLTDASDDIEVFIYLK